MIDRLKKLQAFVDALNAIKNGQQIEFNTLDPTGFAETADPYHEKPEQQPFEWAIHGLFEGTISCRIRNDQIHYWPPWQPELLGTGLILHCKYKAESEASLLTEMLKAINWIREQLNHCQYGDWPN